MHIAPCHCVIGASGKLTRFAGGMENKALLLNLEKTEARVIKGANFEHVVYENVQQAI
jgi:methylated-DNA-[protein]-cysteine S-methyltransferase